MNLQEALDNELWIHHAIGDTYTMDGKPELWKIAYYPIFEDGKTKEVYKEPRALIEKPMIGGTDFREVPLRYLSKKMTKESIYELQKIDCNCNDCKFMKRDLSKPPQKGVNLPINYGQCDRFNKPVSFIPATCQLETQKCFEHRKRKF